VNTSILTEELAPLKSQIEQAGRKKEALEAQLRIVEAELESRSTDMQRFEALKDVCNALNRLGELKADELFWEGVADAREAAGHAERMRGRIASFEKEISGILEKQAALKGQINHCHEELEFLHEEVSDAYDREERRKQEFVIEREISPIAYRAMTMPWTREAESERRFRRAVLVALLICLVFGGPVPLIKLPIPDRSVSVIEIPERLVQLVKKDLPKRAPAKKPVPKNEDTKQPKEEKPKPEQQQIPDKQPKVENPEQPRVAESSGGATAARKKAERVGVLEFKEAFADMMKETTVAGLGTEARLNNESRAKGQAVAQRSLVSIQAQSGSSGGIGYASVSRNVGSGNVDRLGGIGIGSGGGSGGSGGGSGTGIGIGRATSTIANLEESSRPLSDGGALGRTDEEIQIVFDRYKSTLYRIYNLELRRDPTLRGKILMRISIEPSGAVSMCKAESTDLAAPELVDKIVERIKKFNFGPKEGVQKITILYPIDFLPAGE
jgi:uncharacterized membrane protein YgcG